MPLVGNAFTMKKQFILFLLLLPMMASSQFEKNYKPAKYGGSGGRMNYSAYFKKYSFTYSTSDHNLVSKFKNYLYRLHLGYAAACREKYFISEPYFVQYAQSVADTILACNHIQQKVQVVITRSTEPNAYNSGDNKIYLHIGLLKKLENEAQLAFLIGHELSHQLLFHVQNNFYDLEKRSKDKKLKKEIKDISKARYNKLDRTVSLLKNINYDLAKYSRADEVSADSMALELVTKTPYTAYEFDGLMQILDHADEDSTFVPYTNYFETKEWMMNDEWMKAHPARIDFGRKDAIEFDKDSIKTHPDIPNRIKSLQNQITRTGYSDLDKVQYLHPKINFDSLRVASAFEEIEWFNKNKRYAAVLFYSLKLMIDYPENEYLLKNSVVAFNQILQKVKNHTVQNFIPIESEELPPAYNELLRIIDRTDVDELKTILKNYIANKYSKMSSIPEVKSIYNEVCKKN